MAEGGYEEVELEEYQKLGEEYETNYDELDAGKLEEEFGRLRLLKPEGLEGGEVKRRMEYIEDLLVDEHGYAETSFTTEPPDPKRDAKSIKLAITRDKKDFLHNLGLDVNVKDGPASKKLLNEIKITMGANDKPKWNRIWGCESCCVYR